MGHDHDHTHEPFDSPGLFAERAGSDPHRDFADRAFTVGIGGPVGSGKTALLQALCERLRDEYSLGVVTNDIFTREDAEFLLRHKALEQERIVGVETGGCPHAAIREDISLNLNALEDLMDRFAGGHRFTAGRKRRRQLGGSFQPRARRLFGVRHRRVWR